MVAESKDTVKSVETAFKIIEAVQEESETTVSELATKIDLSKSAVYKHLQTLRNERYIIKEDSDTYRIGLRFLNLGQKALQQRETYEVAKPELDSLAEETGEMANLMVEEGGFGVFIYKADSDQAVNLDTYAGKEVHLHTTALGKALLAFSSTEKVDEIIEHHGLPKITGNTIADRPELEECLTTIRERGYAFDEGERLEGLRCVATPILDTEDQPIGAISVSGPASRMQGERFSERIPRKLGRAQNIIELNILYN
jgi:DNA-binding IclR family transcriptional regulator